MEFEKFTKEMNEKELHVFLDEWANYKKKREQLLKNKSKENIDFMLSRRKEVTDLKANYSSIVNKSDPICPFCESEMTKMEDLLSIGLYANENMEDEATWKAICPYCTNEFWLRTHAVYKYDTNKYGNDI